MDSLQIVHGRRQFLSAAAAAGLMSVSLRVRRAIGDTLRVDVLTWPGYDAAELRSSYIARGGTAAFTFLSDSMEGFHKVKAGQRADLVQVLQDESWMWRQEGLLSAIDPSRLSNWSDIFAPLISIPGVTFDNQILIVPTAWGYGSILYRTDLVEPGDASTKSWTLLSNSKYRKRVVHQFSSLIAAMISQKDPGMLSEVPDPSTLPALEALLSNGSDAWDRAAVKKGLEEGSVVAAFAWNDMLKGLEEAGNVRLMRPKEGILTWIEGLVIPASSSSLDAAYAFIDSFISPESGKYLIETFGYGAANRKAFERVDEGILARSGLDHPDDLFALSRYFAALPLQCKDCGSGKEQCNDANCTCGPPCPNRT